MDIDVRGLDCPMPVIKTKKALEKMGEGEITVLIERPEGCENVRRYAESLGCSVTVEEKDSLFHIHIKKEETEKPGLPVQGGAIVFITTDRLGTGDEQLGEILMKSFLNTLWDSEPRPVKIIFMNDGVQLTTEGSHVLDSLALLEKEGVEISSCGTCLEYYEIKDRLKVGLVTNMYEVVESLHSAGKVITI